jgi:uncharacterized OB-fold protein
VILPEPTPTSRPFHAGIARGELAWPRCPACGCWHAYPRPACTACLHAPLALAPLPGTGTVYAVTVVRRALHPWVAELVPYAHALVDLDGGPRVATQLTGPGALEARAGRRVRAVVETDPGRDAPRVLFRLTDL